MKKLLLILMLFSIPGICVAKDHVNIPWEEFKILYKESIEKDVLEKQDNRPFLYSLDQAFYHISLTPQGGTGKLRIQGKSISGEPCVFTLFNNKIIIKDILNVTGGFLLNEQTKSKGILFFPDKKANFSIELSFYLALEEDAISKFVKMKIPNALKNSLTLSLSKEFVILEAPGIQDQTGIYNFEGKSYLNLRFANKTKKAGKKQIKDLSSHFNQVTRPPVVLDSISYFTSFEENGSILSVLVMDVLKQAGPYLKIDSISGAQIWSLKVNNQNMKIYSDEKSQQWVIPLDGKKNSHVEFAMIYQGDKLGLRGRLETCLPGIELAARKINLAIALPERVQLMSFEGPLNSALKNIVSPPKEFIGKPYYFSSSFYKGQSMNIAIMYKEPIK